MTLKIRNLILFGKKYKIQILSGLYSPSWHKILSFVKFSANPSASFEALKVRVVFYFSNFLGCPKTIQICFISFIRELQVVNLQKVHFAHHYNEKRFELWQHFLFLKFLLFMQYRFIYFIMIILLSF